MKDHRKFIEDTKKIFTRYQEIEIEKNSPTSEGLTIKGSYHLYREHENKVYDETFDLEISVSNHHEELYPRVNRFEGIPKGFNHVFDNGTCCLGLNYEILDAWGPRSTEIFFEEILDPYLMNVISFREDEKCITGERPHGGEGVTQYYSKFFTGIPEEKIHNILKYLHGKLIRDERLNRQSPCPCGSGQKLNNCHYEELDRLHSKLKEDSKEAFLKDYKMYTPKERGRDSKTKKT